MTDKDKNIKKNKTEEEAPVEETAAEEEAPVEETAAEEEAPVEETADEEKAPVDVDHNMSDKKTGTVKWFDSKKGYGFIELEGNDDIFVHFSDIAEEGYKSLRDGQKVEFEIEKDDQGEKAKNVTKVEE